MGGRHQAGNQLWANQFWGAGHRRGWGMVCGCSMPFSGMRGLLGGWGAGWGLGWVLVWVSNSCYHEAAIGGGNNKKLCGGGGFVEWQWCTPASSPSGCLHESQS
jgi:hypothetical protein